MENTLRAECARLHIPLTDAQVQKMLAFAQAMLAQNEVMNLTAITQPEDVARLHFADSLALLNMTDFAEKSVVDVGCGAGFPGVPLKIAAPSIDLTLLDSLQKRISWLARATAQLDIPANCVCARAEEWDRREAFDIAVSRAVAPLPILAELCIPQLRVGGVFLAMKAATADEELRRARHAIMVLGCKVEDIVRYEIGGAARCVIVSRKVSKTPTAYPRRYAKIKQQPL
ncbi:MAG: 16S rRNA (guanine(527)-N(7))-methyltransferase RsmG [Oscillospiraceae bacterium]|jgi:16S rRNA (guanine527-N7)-methyltransferase|nr:16S rRNA (guanine(527)-N(7))-methyltransferase RsmG [Oscillospiraceae bacterium]